MESLVRSLVGKSIGPRSFVAKSISYLINRGIATRAVAIIVATEKQKDRRSHRLLHTAPFAFELQRLLVPTSYSCTFILFAAVCCNSLLGASASSSRHRHQYVRRPNADGMARTSPHPHMGTLNSTSGVVSWAKMYTSSDDCTWCITCLPRGPAWRRQRLRRFPR